MSVARAEAEIAKLRTEIAMWERKAAGARERIAKLEAYVDVVREFDSSAAPMSDPTVSRRGSTPKLEVFAAAIREILGDAGGRLQTSVIHKRLLERGMDVGGTNPITNLSSILSRSGEFENDRRLGWGIIGADNNQASPSETADDADAGDDDGGTDPGLNAAPDGEKPSTERFSLAAMPGPS